METILICAVIGLVATVLAYWVAVWIHHHVALVIVGITGALVAPEARSFT